MIEVDDKEVLSLFSRLSSKEQKKAYKYALTDGARILQKEAKRNLKQGLGKAVSHKNRWNGKRLDAGVKVSPQRDIEKDGIKIHILGDFRLKFFEHGTEPRFTYLREGRKGKAYTQTKQNTVRYTRKDGTIVSKTYTQKIGKVYKKDRRIGIKSFRGKVFANKAPLWFFRKATETKEKEIFGRLDSLISKNIQRVAAKK